MSSCRCGRPGPGAANASEIKFGAGAECPAVASENDNTRAQAIVKSGKIVDQLVRHRRRHSVEGIRAIERNDFNRVTGLDGDGHILCHVQNSLAASPSARPQNVTVMG